MSNALKVGFVGLGVMGFPMAGHLAQAGHMVQVYNRTSTKSEQWANKYPGASVATPKAAAEDADIVCMCVGNDDDVLSVLEGSDGILAGLAKGTVVIDHTTTSDALARRAAELVVEREARFIDAPVSGGQAGAENGQLSIMCGASSEDFARAQPLLSVYAKQVTRIGEVGAGQLAKMMNQIAIAGLLQGLAEALHFGERAGIDREQVLAAIQHGAAGSWQMQHRASTMIKDQYDFGFAVDWMRKDLGYALHAAREHGATLPVTALVDQFYADVQSLGGGRLDTSSLLKRFSTKP